MDGNLEVWHGFFSRWVNYYFRTHEDTLIFGPKKQQIEGKIHLKVAQIISIVDDPISFIIHTGTDTLRLRANSIEDRIRWFKKLKKIQKGIEEQNYVKEMSSLNNQKNRGNKIKMLESIVLDLWQCHAELEDQIADIYQKFKGNSTVKSLTDKLRMTVQQIKLKNSQALKIIQQYTRSEREKRGATSNRYGNSPIYEQHENSDYHEPDGTMFMSFDDPKNRLMKRLSKKQSQLSEFKDVPALSKRSIPINGSGNGEQLESSQVVAYKVQTSSIRKMASNRNINIPHPIKQRLLDSNPVFLQTKRYITDENQRTALPAQFTPEQKFPLGTVLKGAAGDLTKFALPVTVNEPLSMLQKGCEQMYYSHLLDQANSEARPQKRMLYIVAFLISQYSLSDQRTKKPFNPLLGQTYEYYDQQRQYNYYSQQVSHHPPISALYCHSNSFQIFDQSKAKTSFSGTSIKITPQGKSKLKLQGYENQVYVYNKCVMCLNGLLYGRTVLQVVGEMRVECKGSGVGAGVRFKEAGFFGGGGVNQVEGEIKINGVKCYAITGKWNEYVKATDLKDKSVLTVWTRTHSCNRLYYNFNEYTLLLNHLNKRTLSQIAPTDSRLRPDQRALEHRNVDLAQKQKLRLEQKQRAKRKQNEERGMEHQIKWFRLERDQDGNQFYVSNQVYEGERERGEWKNYPDIF